MAHSIITHNNKEILFVDHRGLTGDELYESIKGANDFILSKKKEMLAIVDFTDSTGSKKVNEYLQSDEVKAASKYIPKQAVIGVTGIKKMALRIYNMFTGLDVKVLDSIEEAKEYVTKL
ncbi:MAG TPA: hypothetical protein ENN69_03365 [Spirochaetia bacterium]|nr:hypothetical protein [Spirochaetia bacterium]